MAITTITITGTIMSSSSSSESIMEDNIQRAKEIIHKWKIDGHSPSTFVSIFHENNTTEATLFHNSVLTLQRAMHFLSSNDKKSSKLSIAQRLMQIAMKRLEKEFHQLLLDYNRQHLISISVSNLQLIAETMISCGYAKECISVYEITQKSAIDEALFHLGIQQYKHSHMKKMITASHLQNHVKIWLNAFQIAIKTLFNEEKFLCDHVFSSYPAIRNLCFTNSTKEGALNLFTFPDLILAICKRLKSDTLFVKMDLHNSISDLWPEIDSLFSHESISSVKLQAESCLHKLGDSVRTFLTDLESSIQKNSCKVTVTGGGIHPLNNSVMTHLSSLSDYKTALNDVILDNLPCKEHYVNTVSVNFAWIILVLICKLDGKAKFHNYTALSYLFLVNNLHFIIEKVRSTNLKFILGDDWIMIHEKKLKEYVSSYESVSWNKVRTCLPESGLVSPEKVKDCFRKLFFTFEEVYGKQTELIVVDEEMRGKMKKSIANNLVPAYEEFYVKHLVMLSEDERCVKMLVMLSPENMAKYLSELFPGKSKVLRRA